ncbi:AraC family transcriptional regulator [Mesorhizobium sp. L-8-3]|uniref:AraC family transcriptional regulator n=1 Tax=Mesorhizobium sp. L-8-3 TaxID=2744522 RepID=UPI001934ED17|nr:AraC family transcriptional regulator [Mesorhizobium sp. L-8-3]BCH22538.1 AraC family transcriptional regulator [Mesorhizobium sp. L-8-3]
MSPDLGWNEQSGLERLCGRTDEGGIVPAPPFPGLERIDARFFGNAFEPHRHDTYAIGVTLHGVQTFRYRGEVRNSLPGQVIVLHPDEMHDGGAATDAGLHYRILYLEPALLRRSLAASYAPLPFVRDPVVTDRRLRETLLPCLSDIEGELDELAVVQLVTELADGLSRHADGPAPSRITLDVPRLEMARDYLEANLDRVVRSDALEGVTGLDRFSLARQFRAFFGTSPHRYLLMRRLARATALIQAGENLADIAARTGFADQSHLNRQFKKAFGVTPGRWGALTRARRQSPARAGAAFPPFFEKPRRPDSLLSRNSGRKTAAHSCCNCSSGDVTPR